MNLSVNCTSLGSCARLESRPKVGVPTVRLAGGAPGLVKQVEEFRAKLETWDQFCDRLLARTPLGGIGQPRDNPAWFVSRFRRCGLDRRSSNSGCPWTALTQLDFWDLFEATSSWTAPRLMPRRQVALLIDNLVRSPLGWPSRKPYATAH
jgi:hypothetical protein